MNQISKLFATWFYVGLLPIAPGSMGTLAGIVLAYALAGNTVLYVLATILVIVVGLLVGGNVEEVIGKKDPGCVVIDEVAGVMIAFFLLPMSWPVFWSAFFLFRAFDMFKIFPGNKFEGLPGSAGIMLDDIIAGIYTNIVMHLAIRWSGI